MIKLIEKLIKDLNKIKISMGIKGNYEELLIKYKLLFEKNKKSEEDLLKMAEEALERGRSLVALRKAVLDYASLPNTDMRLLSKIELYELEKFVNSSKTGGGEK